MKPSKKRGKKKRKPSSPSPPLATAPGRGGEKFWTKEEEIGQGDGKEEEKRALGWLMGAFASVSIDEVASVYREAGGDPYKAAGILGAQFIDPGDGESTGIEEKKEGFENGKHKKKFKGAAACTGIVADVIGKGYAKPSSACGEGRRCLDGSMEVAKGIENGQYSIEEAEEFLCSMLGDNSELNMGVVRDVLGQCEYNLEKALDALLDISAISYYPLLETEGGNYIETSLSTYPAISSDGSTENIVTSLQLTDETSDSTYHPIEKEHEFLPFVGQGCSNDSKIVDSKEQPSSGSRMVNSDLQQKVLESLFNIPHNPKYEPNGMNWRKVVKQVESFGQGLEFSLADTTEPLINTKNGNVYDYQVSRSAAREHWDTMKTYYQKATLAYSRGERAQAAHLSETGKTYREMAREADERASREIFEARNKDIKNTVTIDLHGQHVKQAIGLLKLHLLLFTYIPSIQFMKVITGSGGYAADGAGKGRLKRSVVNLVVKEGIEWCEENSGTLLLRLDGMKEYSFMDEEESDSE